MKKILLTLTTFLLIFSFYLYFSLFRPLQSCLHLTTTDQTTTCLQQLSHTEKTLHFLDHFIPSSSLDTLISLISISQPLLPHQHYFLGQNQPTTYLILLQNDSELRANGGFFGSYAVLTLDHSQPSLRFQDIYVPDGQIQGHVDPPEPIQQAFRQGWFRLRDSDWDPDFPTAATTIRWFFDKGNEISPDLLVTLPLSTIENILDITGPIELDQYQLSLTSDNLFISLQNLIEQDFFPGSTQKRDVLTTLGQTVSQRLLHLSLQQKLAVIDVLLTSLEQQNIILNSTQPQIQTIFTQNNWAGQLQPTPCTTNLCLADTIAIIETNLGSNKANAYLDRHTTHTITTDSHYLTHQITINYTNNSPEETPNPPQHHGGNYINYLRFYLPLNTENITLTAQPTLPLTLDYYPEPIITSSPLLLPTTTRHEFLETGFFHTTRSLSSSQLTLTYQLPINSSTTYQLSLLKQHGLTSSPQTINILDQQLTTNLEQDFLFNSTLTTD